MDSLAKRSGQPFLFNLKDKRLTVIVHVFVASCVNIPLKILSGKRSLTMANLLIEISKQYLRPRDKIYSYFHPALGSLQNSFEIIPVYNAKRRRVS